MDRLVRSAIRTTSRPTLLPSSRATAPIPTLYSIPAARASSRPFSTSPPCLAPPRKPKPPNVQFVKLGTAEDKGQQQHGWPVKKLPDTPPPADQLSNIPTATTASPFDDLPSLDTAPNTWDSFDLIDRLNRRGPPLRLVPATGRTVHVTGNVDAARAFQLLQVLCRRNRVSADFNRQRFHERGGLKRKRLKSERWRKRFKEGFQAAAKRAQELARQGW